MSPATEIMAIVVAMVALFVDTARDVVDAVAAVVAFAYPMADVITAETFVYYLFPLRLSFTGHSSLHYCCHMC